MEVAGPYAGRIHELNITVNGNNYTATVEEVPLGS